jgi:hypothetical protein
MGFKVGRTFTLEFAGTDLDGAEVVFRSCSVADLLEYEQIEARTDEASWAARFLVRWNLEDHNGDPLPADDLGLLDLEEPAYNLIIREWLKATRGITAPLDHRSNGGANSSAQESPSIPMETR